MSKIVLELLSLFLGLCTVTVSGQAWQCQLEGSCAFQGACANPEPVCPPATCNAAQANYGGQVLILDVNSRVYNGGPNHPPQVTSARQCCAQCASTAGCNTWVFCSKTEGCGSGCTSDQYGSLPPTDQNNDSPLRFGQFGGCYPDGKFPMWMCSLKFNPDPTKPAVFESGASQDWTSGYLANVRSLASPPPNSPPPPPAPPPRAPCYSDYNMSANGVTLRSQLKTVTHTTGANFMGDILVLDTNSWDGIFPAATNAYECASICKSTPQCNVFTFCNSYNEPNSGCGKPGECVPANYGFSSASPNDKARFGPKGGCLSDGRWPRNLCSLKRFSDPANPVSVGATGYVQQFWVSGSFADTIPNLCPEVTGGSGTQTALELLDTANCSTAADPVCLSGLFNVDGGMLVLSVNSMTNGSASSLRGPGYYPPVQGPLDCCDACHRNAACNAWTYCANPQGCGTCNQSQFGFVKNSNQSAMRFGPYGSCTPNGRWPYKLCSLKVANLTKPKILEAGTSTPWVSGFVTRCIGDGFGSAPGLAPSI
eukprot:jgi/Botrbrau1/8354/Bobra.0046s0015.1